VTAPLVTVGVPVYRGQDTLPTLLECLRTQTYQEIDVLISVDGGDEASKQACLPFLERDSRFRVEVQASRLGWAGNTDWTMRHRHGDFYIYQQHDDLISQTYVADLVEAAARWPDAVICFARVQITGRRQVHESAPSLLGDPMARALKYLRRLDWVPFRGLIRGSALDRTSGLLLSDFDPFDSFGTEFRFMAELSLIGEFRLVEGPIYFKSWHGENLSAKRQGWSREHEMTAFACLAAWMIEVVVPAGASAPERRDLFGITLGRFDGRQDLFEWIASVHAWLRRAESKPTIPARLIRDHLKGSDITTPATTGLMPGGQFSALERPDLLRQIFERLRRDGRFDPRATLNTTWEALESEILSERAGG
jgi:glycosyltransferase involved in cell wall biosynthesis